jgi:hypothetical protein
VSANLTLESIDMAAERKPRKKAVKPPVDPFTTTTLLEAAEACLRDALKAAIPTAHPIQLEGITDALLSLESAKHLFTHDVAYFTEKAHEDDE